MKLLLVAVLVACSSSSAPQPSKPTPQVSKPTPQVSKPTAHEASKPTAHEAAPASCPQKPLAKGCPASEPNVNHPCSRKGLECTYAPGCCPSPVYVCNASLHFEARFTRCN